MASRDKSLSHLIWVQEIVKRISSRRDVTVLEKGDPPCFAAGTLVHTREGLKPIEDIQVDDWVLSYPDEQTTPDRFRRDDEYTYRKVMQVFVKEDQPISKLIVDNLATGDSEAIFVTANHPIYCQYRGWVAASELHATDVVENYQFRHLMVRRTYADFGMARVYNFELDEFHTYYVGQQGVWVHNACEIKPLYGLASEGPI